MSAQHLNLAVNASAQVADQVQATFAQRYLEGRAKVATTGGQPCTIDLAALQQRLLKKLLHAFVTVGRALLHQGLGDNEVQACEGSQQLGACGIDVQGSQPGGRNPRLQALPAREVQGHQTAQFAAVGEG